LEGLEVKNSIDFIEKVKDTIEADDGILVSVDVVSPCPSKFVDDACDAMTEHFVSMKNLKAHRLCNIRLSNNQDFG
jgi:hypothetical protein